MIIDKTENLKNYAKLLPNLQAGLDKVASLGSDPEVGRYEFDGGFFMIQKGLTSPAADGDFEAHRKYIDVQIILKGAEYVIWDEISNLKETVPYDAAKERVMLGGQVKHTFRIDAGMSWVAFPQDAHKACKHLDSQTEYVKVVMKLPVE